MQRVVIGAACAASVAIGLFNCFALASRYVVHGAVSASSLGESVRYEAEDSMGLLVEGRCRSARAQTWTCTMTDYDVGGQATYRVTRRGDSSCWNASLVPASTRYGPVPETLSGCVHAWQWEVVDLIGGWDYPD